MEDSVLPEDYRRSLATIDYRSPSVKYNFALDRLPQFNTHEKVTPTGTIHLGAQTLDELDTAYTEAVAGRASTNPMIEMTIPSVLDNTLAPEGKHVASAFVQYAPILDKDDQDWSQVYQDMSEGVLRAVEAVAPGFSDSILHMDVLAAPDLERIYGITGGNIFHGAMTPDRLALFRPFPGWANYTTPIPNFFLCGSGTHPGGGVMGAPGRNAARVISRKL
jgi:phytoene dehydrogenase-like protein